MSDAASAPAAPAAPAAAAPAAGAPPAAAGAAAPVPPAAPAQAAAAAPAPPVAPGAADPDLPPDGAPAEAQIEHWKKRANDLRATLGARGAVPKDAEGYALTYEGDLAPYGDQLKADPVFKTMREQFHAAGLTDKQAQAVVTGTLGALLANGQLDAPFDPQKEAQALFPRESDPARLKSLTATAVNANLAFLDGLKDQGFSERALGALRDMQDRAAGIEAVQAISRMGRPAGPITDGAGASQANVASLDQRFADPRNNPLNPKFDRPFAEETQRMAQALYKDAPAA